MKKRRLWVALLVLIALVTPATAEWTNLEPGLEYRQVWLADFARESLHQVRVDLNVFRLGIVYAPDYGSKSLTSGGLLRQCGAVVVINSAYFDEEWQACGYLSDGARHLVKEIAAGSTLTGFFLYNEQGPEIVTREEFTPGTEQLAFQAGPRLIVDSKPVEGLLDERRRRRVGVAVDTEGRVVLYVSGIGLGLTMQDCQRILLSPASEGGIDPVAVLNLDGGRSTQMTLNSDDTWLTVPGLRTVPVGLGVFRKSQ